MSSTVTTASVQGHLAERAGALGRDGVSLCWVPHADPRLGEGCCDATLRPLFSDLGSVTIHYVVLHKDPLTLLH